MTQATKRPWKFQPAYRAKLSPRIISEDKERKEICYFNLDGSANAKLIVKAVNCHDELIEALKGTVRAIEYLSGTTKHSILYNNAKQALSKAQEEI